MANVTSERQDDLAIVRIERPPVNALDVATLQELADRLDDAELEGVSGVVLTGADKMFSAGADLKAVLEGDAGYIEAGIDALTRAFRSLFTFPRPVVAAVNGHALAGGAVLTCACDYRVMGARGLIGAIELRAGVPFPAWALEIVRFGVNNEHLQEVVGLGRAYVPEEARRKGLVDEVVDGDVAERAIEVAHELAGVPASSFALTKRALRAATVDAADRLSDAIDDEVKAAWRSDEVREAIRRQMDALRND